MLLKDKLAGWRLILASGSPRRRQILTDAGLPFTLAASYDVAEVWPAELPADKVAEYLAALKSEGYPEPLGPRDILLTADTTVVLGERILGKPRDEAEAQEMLTALSGREHRVVTGVCLRTAEGSEVFSAETTVHFCALTAEEIEYYARTFRPMDKAGAYAIQEWIGYVAIEGIEGSYYNVIGLPIQQIYSKLNNMINPRI
jgi:septum formation protein